ncbi:nitroreductase family protein [Enterococcus sp. 669A]|uniref:Nitroreductase family protein n=1 Tax=Candidatus Enterococcus moelleringii TaxID=2815325 RepID=A0ABS3LCF9_9ENTE|nr:nitroreductase family protein [Enterococcus sp. 669A]MBO1307318.1 nitroreductase family protein [Enterococcus sp. 669A]
MNSNFFELAANRRSIRKFTGETVDEKDVEEIVKTALLAPSSWGGHPVEFVVIKDKKKIRDIAACKAMGAGPLSSADVAIVVLVNKKNLELWIEDGAIASAYLLLAAEERGIGACWIHIRDRMGKRKSADEEIRDILGVPNNYTVLNCVALGQKKEHKAPRSESKLHLENIHYEQFESKKK